MDREPDQVFGIDWEVLEEFLALIREWYPVADNAYFFLEHHVGVSATNSSIANLRDILSHLYSLLGEEDLTAEEQREQIASAKEHLRRAIFEPYEIAIGVKASHLKSLLWRYRLFVGTFKAFKLFPLAPDMHVINAQVSRINDMRTEARNRKRINRMNEEWQEGVKYNIDAFLTTQKLCEELDHHIYKSLPILATVILGILAMIVAVLVAV